jgi:hypothetical protein
VDALLGLSSVEARITKADACRGQDASEGRIGRDKPLSDQLMVALDRVQMGVRGGVGRQALKLLLDIPEGLVLNGEYLQELFQ